MYTLRFWTSHLRSVRVDLFHQKLARTVGDPITADVARKVTQVSRMTDVHLKFLEKSP